MKRLAVIPIVLLMGCCSQIVLVGCSSPQQRMKDCNVEAGEKKGEERKAFMSVCLKNPGI